MPCGDHEGKELIAEERIMGERKWSEEVAFFMDLAPEKIPETVEGKMQEAYQAIRQNGGKKNVKGKIGARADNGSGI